MTLYLKRNWVLDVSIMVCPLTALLIRHSPCHVILFHTANRSEVDTWAEGSMVINEKPEKNVPVPSSIQELMASKTDSWGGHRKQATPLLRL